MLWGRSYRLLLTIKIISCITAGSCSGGVLVIGHRGNSLFAPENTLSSFAAARGKADMVETDARLSADGQLVIMHDNTVDRTTDGTGTVASQTVAQLKLLDAGSWFSPNFAGERIPTLTEMLARTLPYMPVLIEQKDGAASVYVDTLRRAGAVTNLILQSFDWNFLRTVHTLEPAVPLCALGSGSLDAAAVENIVSTGARIVAWEKSTVTSAEVARVHGANLALYVWTVDGAEIKNFIDLGADGIISNDPGMVKVLQEGQTNAASVLGESLVAYWKMDDGLTQPFATTVSDSEARNPGTLVRNDGASHWFDESVAQLKGCLKLEGTNAFVLVNPSTSLDLNTNQMSFSAWVRLSALPSQLSTSYGAIYDSTTDCYVLYLDKANKELRFKVTDRNGHAARPGIPEAYLSTHAWLHVAATFSGNAGPASGQATIFLNGQPRDVHTGNDGTTPVGLTAAIKSGQSAAMGREGSTGGNYFTGYVDDVALWSRSLSPAEVLAIFNAGQTGLSLADLLVSPTTLLQVRTLRLSSSGTQLEINFLSTGPWSTFHLLRATHPAGPFNRVEGLEAISVGGELYRFVYGLTNPPQMFFRIVAP